MNNEEILMAAQSESGEMGEFEKTISRKAITYGAAFGVAICMFMIAIELIFFQKLDFGKPTILFGISAYANLYEGRKNKIKKMTVKGSIEAVMTVLGLLLYVGALLV